MGNTNAAGNSGIFSSGSGGMNHDTMRRAGFSPYGPSKAALESETVIWAQDLAGTGVTVNGLLPGGATDTGMIPDGVPEAGFALSGSPVPCALAPGA
jgi:NAD(P)-dependent dehydrogenase (short-subunit alcohol dehydrogenase family)